MVKANRRYTLALSLHRRSDTALDALKRVLDTARRAGLRIRRLMLDREFDNNAVVGYLLEQPFPTIMPLMIRDKKGGARRAIPDALAADELAAPVVVAVCHTG